MGLDISAYSKMTPAPGIGDENLAAYWAEIIAHQEKSFPGRTEGLTSGSHFKCEELHAFRAGSYGGYNWWRNQLALMAYGKSAEEIWSDPNLAGPFIEVINFSDCEGIIGPVVAAKLARDFSNHIEQAKRFAPQRSGDDDPIFDSNPPSERQGWFLEAYQLWARAFELAADGGCVRFH
jgi:hypothetical protein